MNEPWKYADGDGDLIKVTEGRDGVFVSVTENRQQSRAFLPSAEFLRFSLALWQQAGKLMPVILNRPVILATECADDGDLGVWLSEGGKVVVSLGGFCVERTPDSADKAAALIAAYAEAARSRQPEPDPAAVERMASLLADAHRMAPEDAARYLIGKGVTPPGEDSGNG